MRTPIFLSACMLSLVWFSHAQAKSGSRSSAEDAKAKAAKIACAAGDFHKGVQILAEIYVDTDDTNYIYNQGRCYEQNHQWVSAIDRFREYLRKTAKISADDAADTQKHIADCRRFQDDEEKQPSSPATPAAAAPSLPAPQPIAVSTPVVIAPAPPQADTGSVLTTTGIAVGGVGLAGIATGVILNVKANQAANSGSDSSQNSYKTGSLVCYSVGGVALVTGVVLYLVGRKRTEAGTASVALFPMWTPGGATLALTGGF